MCAGATAVGGVQRAEFRKTNFFPINNGDYCTFKTDTEHKHHLISYPINSIWLFGSLIDILELKEKS